MVEYVDHPDLVPPHGYHHAAVVDRPVVYTAGQTAMAVDGSIDCGEDLTEQTVRALTNVARALESGGSGVDRIVQLELFVVGLAEESTAAVFRGMGRAARSLQLPAVPTTVLGVAALSIPGALVEVRAVGAI